MIASPPVPPERRIGRFGRTFLVMISLMLGLQTHLPPAAAAETGIGPRATLAPFSRDRTVFDANGANGGNAADIPLSGSTDAPDGAQIEARVVHAGTGAQVHPWTPVATASGGAWAGAYPAVPRAATWLRPEARVRGSAAAPARMATSFGVGAVLVIQGQSNIDRGVNGVDTLRADSVTIGQSDGRFQVAWSGNVDGVGPVGPVPVDDTTTGGVNGRPVTASVARMAAAINALAPGVPVMVGFVTYSGSQVRNLLHDGAGTDRAWSTDVTNPAGTGVIDRLTADGAEIGAFHMTHGAGLDGLEGLARVTLGTTAAGVPVPGIDRDAPFPDHVDPAVGSPINHVFTAAMPGLKTGRTRWLTSGGGSVEAGAAYTGVADLDVTVRRAAEATPHLGARAVPFLPVTFGGIKTDDDRLHFSRQDLRGMPERFAGLGAQFAWATGLATPTDPAFDQVTWAADRVRLASSAGPVTTRAIADNGGPLAAGDYFPDDPTDAPGTPGFSEVLGFFDGTLAPLRAAIVDGAVEVYPPEGRDFDGLSQVYYLAATDDGGAITKGGWPSPGGGRPGDYDMAQWSDHLPVILDPAWAWSIYGGRLVGPAEDGEVINAANALSAGEATFAVDGGAPAFVSLENLGQAQPGAITGLTVEARFRRRPGSGLRLVHNDGNTGAFVKLNLQSSEDFVFEVADADGRNLVQTTVSAAAMRAASSTGTFSDRLHTLRAVLHVDPAATAGSAVRVFVDGTEVSHPALGPGAARGRGNLRGNVTLSLFDTGRSGADVARIAVWAEANAAGDLPAGPPWIAAAADGAGGVVLSGLAQR